MKITKTTLLFIATLFFLALPIVFSSGNAQAATYPGYNWTGAEHNADGGWTAPANNGSCWGVDSSDPLGTAGHDLGTRQTAADAYCRSLAPTWLADLNANNDTYCNATWGVTCQTECANLGLEWHTYSSPADCINMWVTDSSVAASTGRANHECLFCHDGGYASNKIGYLKSAHANASRPTVDQNAWITPIEEGSTPYTLSSGYAIDWANDSLDMGTCTVAGNTTEADCTAASGTWTAAPTQMYWMFGSWLEGAADSARVIHAGQSSGSAWIGCMRCHSTGFEADASQNTNLLPYRTLGTVASLTDAYGVFGPSFSLSGGNVSAADFSGTTQNWAGWQQWGITCSRCHDAMNGGHANSGTGTTQLNGSGFTANTLNTNDVSTDATAGVEQLTVCYQCHYQNNGSDLRDSNVTNPGEQLTYNSSSIVERHANGYLNSPHAMFTGTYGQLGDTSAYESHFVTSDGTCAGCHNVHDSVTDNAADSQTWENECGLDCHNQDPTSPYSKPLADIEHPTGPGTPLYGATVDDPVSACQTCHMPDSLHIFRINADPTYSTKPASGNFITTVPDPSNNNFPAAYIDLDLACGQCHGGGDSTTVAASEAVAQAHGAPYMTKDELAQYAVVMHGGTGSSAPTGNLFMWTNDTSNDYQVNFAVTGNACTEGGCSYSWDFGDGNTGSGAAISHTYTSAASVNVTLTTSNGGSNTQVVTPTAVHAAPTCGATSAPTAGNVGTAVTFTDASSPSTASVYINWGDGSPMSVGAAGSAAPSHTYQNPGDYYITQIVQDDLGYNCTQKYPIVISVAGIVPPTDQLTIDPSDASLAWTTNAECTGWQAPAECCTAAGTGWCDDTITDPTASPTGANANPQISYYIYAPDAFGVQRIAAAGYFALGDASFQVSKLFGAGTYNITFDFPSGHSCDFTAATTGTVTIPSTVTIANCH